MKRPIQLVLLLTFAAFIVAGCKVAGGGGGSPAPPMLTMMGAGD
jgi:hypothetical protein